MSTIIETASSVYDRSVNAIGHLDGVASLLIRLILGPVLIAAGWEKLTGDNWFGFQLESFPFPFNVLPPELSWFLASWTEFLGGILLLVGLGTRIVAVPPGNILTPSGLTIFVSLCLAGFANATSWKFGTCGRIVTE